MPNGFGRVGLITPRLLDPKLKGSHSHMLILHCAQAVSPPRFLVFWRWGFSHP